MHTLHRTFPSALLNAVLPQDLWGKIVANLPLVNAIRARSIDKSFKSNEFIQADIQTRIAMKKGNWIPPMTVKSLDRLSSGNVGSLNHHGPLSQSTILALEKFNIPTLTFTHDPSSEPPSIVTSLVSAIDHGSLRNLEELSTMHCKIDADEMRNLSKAFKQLPNLKKLWLLDNNIGDGGMKYLAEDAIATGSLGKLELLVLDQNKISDDGMIAFSNAIANANKPLRNLKRLWLDNNEISNGGMIAFSKAIANESLPNLEHLRLRGNKIKSEGVAALENASIDQSLPKLVLLDLFNNSMNSMSLSSLAHSIGNRSLKRCVLRATM